MANLNEYKCPLCGGALEFHAGSQKLFCPFCDSSFDPELFSETDAMLSAGTSGTEGSETVIAGQDNGFKQDVHNTWADGETDGLYTYVCKSCGGEILGDSTLASTMCPYCGNPVVIMGAFKGNLKPDYVIPFKFDKKQAVAALEEHTKGKRFLPKVFRALNKINEIKGIYIPFWIFDTDTSGDYAYQGTKEEEWEDSRYRYKRTSYYKIERQGLVNFRKIPIGCSEKANQAIMESLEPFDMSQAVDFQTAYLAGYVADKFDINTDVSWERAKERVVNSSSSYFYNTVKGYKSVIQKHGTVTILEKSAKYALFPVWMLSTTYNGTQYTFAMNGQSGKMVGDLPMDKKAFARWLILLTLGIAAGLFLISVLFI